VTEPHADEQVTYDGDQVPDDEAGEQVSYDEAGEQVTYDEAGEQHDDEPGPPEPDDRSVPDALPSHGADPRVAAAVARLDELGDTPPAEHVEVYEDVHRVLQDAMADAALTSETGDQGEPGPEDARP
jgi:hypothetical protein